MPGQVMQIMVEGYMKLPGLTTFNNLSDDMFDDSFLEATIAI
ncbi:MAG: hypothetical protein ACLTAI_13770 [Thomasclavelia sp.]